MEKEIVLLMAVETADSRVLVEAPYMPNILTGMGAKADQLQGEIKMILATHKGSGSYRLAQFLAGQIYPVTEIYQPVSQNWA